MADGGHGRTLQINMDDRGLSVVVFSLFFSWLLAFPFEGQILYALASNFNLEPHGIIFGAIASHFAGLFLCGAVIRTMRSAKRLMMSSIVCCILGTGVFFFAPSVLWHIALILCAFLAGGCVAAWGFYLKSATPQNERIKTVADGLIYSNLLMIILNMSAIHLSPYAGLALSMLLLAAAFVFALRLPADGDKAAPSSSEQADTRVSIIKPLIFLCLFIIIITINSGLMYQVLNPAFAHLEWLTSWYWAIPYIIALFVMRNLPPKTNRAYILYVAIAMIGFSFIAFMSLDRSAASYLVVDTLMLGACGVYDLFWWSILGEMLEFDRNPAKVFGIGLSSNVLGVLLGGLIGTAITLAGGDSQNSTLIALGVVCITLVILPLLHKRLSVVLKDHVYLTVLSEMPPEEKSRFLNSTIALEQLTERECEIANLLFRGKTYKAIAAELHISENTVKTHIKNIYAKYKIQNRTELFNIMLEQRASINQ
ncbi:helix-turn-helix transcriptional regulator [Desulfotruncus alcoholivorax]|uniref:helix-turn-helix transcriptional regulator n=1 Tax=Desulfotruncus alcoholivorax TaxID=265477 RepID=UPI00041D88FD|nr:helix-turn-helix transcriptional regulator [Desulfotruncus alcoholivorax]